MEAITRNKNYSIKATGIVGLLLLFVSSCYYDKEDKLYDQYYANKNCDTTTVTYSLTIKPIVAAKCANSGCHTAGGTGNGNFDTYAGVKAKVDNGSFLNRTVVLMNMPTSGPLNSCELVQVRKWIELGAPNN
jgi:hypothetical protein